jgi:hypothetical protein
VCRFLVQKIQEPKPDTASLDELSLIPFLNTSEAISNLKQELPYYLSKSADISSDMCPLVWWKNNSPELPH